MSLFQFSADLKVKMYLLRHDIFLLINIALKVKLSLFTLESCLETLGCHCQFRDSRSRHTHNIHICPGADEKISFRTLLKSPASYNFKMLCYCTVSMVIPQLRRVQSY
jgi:hypothetical protein